MIGASGVVDTAAAMVQRFATVAVGAPDPAQEALAQRSSSTIATRVDVAIGIGGRRSGPGGERRGPSGSTG